MPGGAAAADAPPINDLNTPTSTKEQFQTKAPANRGGNEAQPRRRFERRGRIYVAARQPAAPQSERCIMNYVLCTMYNVLWIMYNVEYTMY